MHPKVCAVLSVAALFSCLQLSAANPWHDYREEYAVSEIASAGNAVKDNSKGILVAEYAEKNGQRVYEIDALGNRTDYKYNDKGQLSSLSVNGELQNAFAYDKFGRLASASDVLGRTTSRIYDSEGWLSGLINPDSSKSAIELDKYGQVAAKKGADGYDLSYTYTSFGEIASYTDGNGATTRFEYDNGGS